MKNPRRANIHAEAAVMARRVDLRDETLVRRPWTRSERSVVLGGVFGRLLIAIEPAICFLVFAALTLGLIFHPPTPANLEGAKGHEHDLAIVIAPIFGFAALCFFAYFVAVLVRPIRALLHTFSPIFIVDGYVRYRRPDRNTDGCFNGYVAVLSDERRTVAEWPLVGDEAVVDSIRPALIEFSRYGGIHRIDGRSTGVIPESMPALGGIGANLPRI
jgi:hypothetical protein